MCQRKLLGWTIFRLPHFFQRILSFFRKKTHHHEIRFVTIFFNALGSLRNKENKGTVRQRSQSPLISSVAPFSPAAERFFPNFPRRYPIQKIAPPKTDECPLKKDCLNRKCIFHPLILGDMFVSGEWWVPFNQNVSSHHLGLSASWERMKKHVNLAPSQNNLFV